MPSPEERDWGRKEKNRWMRANGSRITTWDKVVVGPTHMVGEGRVLSDRPCAVPPPIDGKIIIGSFRTSNLTLTIHAGKKRINSKNYL